MVAEYVLISWIPLNFKFTFPKKLHRGVNESYFHYLDGYTMYLQKCYPKAYELMFWVGFFFLQSIHNGHSKKKKHSYSKLMTSKINKYTIDLKGNKSLIQNKTKDYNCR